jgi:hypothetical protein
MWHCQKCGEEIEGSFDACWKCGTSRDGAEPAEFWVETDVQDAEPPDTPGPRWSGFLAGAVVVMVIGLIEWLVPYLIAMPGNAVIRQRLPGIVVAGVVFALVLGAGGAVAGWIGAKHERLIDAAWKGSVIVLVCQLLLVMANSQLGWFLAMPMGKICAVIANAGALGAIAGSTGLIASRARHRRNTQDRISVQYHLSDMLFLAALVCILLASLAVMSRQ